MDSFSWFVLSVLVLVGLAHAHIRIVRSSLIKHLEKSGKSSDEIVKIMKAYKED